jgi:hypothetical protein
MRKIEEINNPSSCLNKAINTEMVFVLLARDLAAPYAIEKWIEKRIQLGLNKLDDSQIEEAMRTIKEMERVQGK